MSTGDDKSRTERAFIALLASCIDGVQFISGSDRDTIAEPVRVSITAKASPIPGCIGFPADVEVLILTPDTTPAEDRAALVRKVECTLRKFERERLYFGDDIDLTFCGYALSDTADSSEGQMNGDLIRLRVGVSRGNS